MIINQAMSFMSIGILLCPQIISAAEVVSPDSQLKSIQEDKTIESTAQKVVNVEESTPTPNKSTSEQGVDNSQETKSSDTWGTSALSWDSATKTLTISAGTLSAITSSKQNVGNSSIPKASVEHIILEPGVIAPQNSSYLFSDYFVEDPINLTGGPKYSYENLIDISGQLDTSQVTNMNSMFVSAGYKTPAKHVSVDVSNWNTSQVTNMHRLFASWTDPTLDVSGWDTSKVTDMGRMFAGVGLSSLDLSGLEVSQVVNMRYMLSGNIYDGSSSLVSVNVSGWGPTTADMQAMFSDTRNLKEIIGHESWIVNSTIVQEMFSYSGIETLDLSHWFQTGGGRKNMASMFQSSNITTLNASGWKGVNDGQELFGDTLQLQNLDISNWKLSNEVSLPLSLYQAFKGTKLKKLDLSTWDTDQKDGALQRIFQDAASIEELKLGPGILGINSDSHPLFGTMIPDIDTSSGMYTGRWERIDPPGKTFESSNDFMSNYQGGVAWAGTYVWQKTPEVVVKDSTIHVGDTWTASDNFVSASYPTSGTAIPFSDISVTGNVNTSTPGDYPITYSYDNGGYDKGSATATITVSAQSINGSDVTKYVNDPLPADSEFNASATDALGNPIGVSIDKSSVDMSKAGDYDVFITADDGQTKTVKVYVLENLILSVPENNNFGAYKLGEASKTLPWDTTNKVEVSASPGKNWTLTVSMVNTDTLFPYVKVGNTAISDTPLSVTSGTGNSIVSDTVPSEDFLKVDYEGVTTPGNYSGTLQWQLTPTMKEVQE